MSNDTNQAFTERSLPYNLDAEAAVLGACLLDPTALDIALEQMRTSDFFKHGHQRVFEACKALAGSNQPVDLVTVQGWLVNQGYIDSVGGSVALAGLTERVASAANVEAYIKIVAEGAQLRALIAKTAQIQQMAYEPGAVAATVMDHAAAVMLDSEMAHTSSRPEAIGDVMVRTMDLIHSYEKRTEIDHATGFPELDEILQGMHPGEMTVIAGRPGSGKTAFGLNIATELGVVQKRPGAIFSFEMNPEMLLIRMVSSIGSVDATHIRRGRLTEQEKNNLVRASSLAFTAPIHLTKPGQMDVDGIRVGIRRMKKLLGITWAFVDYIQRVPSGLKRADNRAQEVGHISRTLADVARDTGVRLLVAAQLNRDSVKSNAGTNSPARKPRLSDLRESGDIEQDASNVLLLHRPGLENMEELDQVGDQEAEVIVAKQRNGQTGLVKLAWQGKYTRYARIAAPPPPPASGWSPDQNRRRPYEP